jgi:uncharacterized protein (DUF433 family)
MTFEKPLDRITIEPDKMGGEPCIRSLRITVRNVLAYLVTYPDRSELLRAFPELEEEDIRQALLFASAGLKDFMVPLRIAS